MRGVIQLAAVAFVGAVALGSHQVAARNLGQNAARQVFAAPRPTVRAPAVQYHPVVARPPTVQYRSIAAAVEQARRLPARGGHPFNVTGVPHRDWGHYRPAHLVRGLVVPGVGAHYFLNTNDGIELAPSGVDNSGPPFDIESFIQSLLPDGSAPNAAPDGFYPPARVVDNNDTGPATPEALPPSPDAQDAGMPPAANQNVETVLPLKISHWVYNGSVVYLVANGAHRRFYADAPKVYYDRAQTGVIAVGVRNNTLLFDGTQDGSRYLGKAYVPSEHCGPTTYAVGGSLSADQRRLTMNGQAPRFDSQCQRVGERDDLPVALTFEKAPE
jgi:hypothetical protein